MNTNENAAPADVQREPETFEQFLARTGMTAEQVAELTPEQLEEIAGGADWLDTLVKQWNEIKHGIVDGWNGGLTR